MGRQGMARGRRLTGILGATCALVFGVSSTANAAAFTWQGYTRDSSWNCGPAGSTKYVNGMYLLACVKTAGADWQAILIASSTSQGRYIRDLQIEWEISGNSTELNPGYCAPPPNQAVYFYPNSSWACFSPTVYAPSQLVEGEFKVDVSTDPYFNGQQSVDIYSPAVWTSS
jgi:hypothetical protein